MTKLLLVLEDSNEKVIFTAKMIAHDGELDSKEIIDINSAIKFILDTHGLTSTVSSYEDYRLRG